MNQTNELFGFKKKIIAKKILMMITKHQFKKIYIRASCISNKTQKKKNEKQAGISSLGMPKVAPNLGEHNRWWEREEEIWFFLKDTKKKNISLLKSYRVVCFDKVTFCTVQ